MDKSRIVSTVITRPPSEVVETVRDYRRLPEWLSFISGVREDGGRWLMDTPEGAMQIEFLPTNEPGVLDHRVTLATGQTFHNSMRVVPRGAGSEVQFTLIQAAGVSEEQFAADAETVQTDLDNLRRLLERPQGE